MIKTSDRSRDKFYSKYISTHTSHLYGEVSLSDIKRQFPAWHRYYRKFLPEDKTIRVVDVGCGNGGFVYWLQEIGYLNSEGIDISIEQVEAAKKLGIKNINQSDLYKLFTIKQDFYDIVIMKDVIEHFNKEEILRVMELVYNALKNNGYFIIQTPNAESPFSGRFRYYDFTHEISFTGKSLRQTLLVSNFRDIHIHSTPPVVHGIKSLVRYLLWKGIELCLRFYLVVETGSGKGIFTQNIIAAAKK